MPENDKREQTFSTRLLNWLGFEPGKDETAEVPSTVVLDRNARDGSIACLPAHLRQRYEVRQALGRGAFGMVYLARDNHIGRLIAIKQLYSHYRQRDEIYRRFLQEARIAGQLENPNIVTIYDVADDGDCACIIMEYLAGGHLRNILDQEGSIGEEGALIYMKGILGGLAMAHSMGVVHRDIKPRNILFDQSGIPKISDFGVAHLPVEAGGINTPDDALNIVGTPEYMAPEQMDTRLKVDARTDIYAAGLLFYEMLTDEQCFNFENIQDMHKMAEIVRTTNLAKTLTFAASISDKVRQIIVRMTQRTPRDRYPDARSCLIDIEAALRESVAERRRNALAEGTPEYREMYADILRLFLVDGVISLPERRELVKRAERLGIAATIARHIEERIRNELGLPLLVHLEGFRATAERLLRDREYSPADKQTLRDLGKQYGISLEEQHKIEDEVMTKFHMKQTPEPEPRP